MGEVLMPNYRPFAFVLMPFGKEFEDVYKFGIKETAEKCGLVAERVDEQHFSETILERIYRQIENSDFVIADMTGRNPNVFYEVGYAHAKGKQCALITKDADDIPFDLKHHPHVIYDGSISDLKGKLEPKLEWLKRETEKRNTEAIYLSTSNEWLLSVDGVDCPSVSNSTGTLKRSLITPRLRRLAPNAFSQEKIKFSRTFWSKFRGEEAKEKYTSKGVVGVEIATSEGSFSYSFVIEVDFEEIPF